MTYTKLGDESVYTGNEIVLQSNSKIRYGHIRFGFQRSGMHLGLVQENLKYNGGQYFCIQKSAQYKVQTRTIYTVHITSLLYTELGFTLTSATLVFYWPHILFKAMH